MVGGVAIGDNISRVRNRDVPEKKQSFDVRRVGLELGLNQAFDLKDGIIAVNVEADDGPTVAVRSCSRTESSFVSSAA